MFYSDSGLGTRVAALGTGITATPAQGIPGLAAQAALRLDGTSFAGHILQAQRSGQPRLSAAYVPESLLIALPRAAWPSKLSSAGLDPSRRRWLTSGCSRSTFLPGLAGLYTGFLSWQWLMAFLAAWGAGERWLLRRRSPARLVLLAGALSAALFFEAGLPAMAMTLRAAAVVAGAAWLAARRVRSRTLGVVRDDQCETGASVAARA